MDCSQPRESGAIRGVNQQNQDYFNIVQMRKAKNMQAK